MAEGAVARPQVGRWEDRGLSAGAAAGGGAAAKPVRSLERRVSFRAPTTGMRFPGLPTSTRVNETQRATFFHGSGGPGEAVTHVSVQRRMEMKDVPYGAPSGSIASSFLPPCCACRADAAAGARFAAGDWKSDQCRVAARAAEVPTPPFLLRGRRR